VKKRVVYALLFSILFLGLNSAQQALSIDKPVDPDKFQQDYDLRLGEPPLLLYQKALLVYLQDKEQNLKTSVDQIRFNLDALPELANYPRITNDLLKKVAGIEKERISILERVQALEADRKRFQEENKVYFRTFEWRLQGYQNMVSDEDYRAKKLPRATILSYEVPNVISNDFSKPIYIKIKVRTFQPIMIITTLIGDGFSDHSNNFYIEPKTPTEFRDRYEQDSGSTALINNKWALRGLKVVETRIWNKDGSIDDTYVIRIINGTRKELSKIQIAIQERSITDCLNIYFDPAKVQDTSGASGCIEVGPQRPPVISRFATTSETTDIEQDFNKYYEMQKQSFQLGLSASLLTDYPDYHLSDYTGLATKAKLLLAKARALQEEIIQSTSVSSAKKTTITCVKGKLTKKVTAVKPKCPTGYTVKK
jgi:hypothetical protein